jgi:hypothetical protein
MRAAIFVLLVACTTKPTLGPPTGAVCPADSTLTYQSFGKPFMDHYCTECHDSMKLGAARKGAPDFHDFDTLFGIRGVANHIDESTAAGPHAFNDSMPEDDPKPSDMERYQLGEWLACGAP